MKNKVCLFVAFLFIVSIFYGANLQQKSAKKERMWVEKSPKEQITGTNYKDVRIKKFPIAVQCWTFRKFSFFETLDKVKELGVFYLQPYPGQKLDSEGPVNRFDHNMSEDQIKQVKQKLKEYGIRLVSYGVVYFENNEESMRKVFDFAKKMGIRTIVTEPRF